MPVYRVEDSQTGVVLDLEGDSPPTDQELADIFSQYARPARLPEPEEEDSYSWQEFEEDVDYAAGIPWQMARGFVGGVGAGVLGVPAGLAALADSAMNLAGYEDLIDSGQQNELIRVADAGKEVIDKYFGVDEQYKDAWLVDLGGALGQLATFAIPGTAAAKGASALGMAAKGAAVVGTATVATQGALLAADEGRQRVDNLRQMGVEIDQDAADLGILIHSAIGTTEALPFKRFFEKIAKTLPPGVKEKAFREFKSKALNVFRSAAAQGFAEGTQEMLAGIAQDAVELGIYNPEDDRPLLNTETMFDEFTLGGAAGAIMDAVTTGVLGRHGRITRSAEREREAQLREKEAEASTRYMELAEAAKQIAEAQRITGIQMAALDAENAVRAEGAARELEAREASAQVDPATIPYESPATILYEGEAAVESGRDPRVDAMRGYAQRIAKNVRRSGIDAFPSSGKFDVTERQSTDEQGNAEVLYQVEHAESNQQYGQSFRDREDAVHLMSNLNGQIRITNLDRSLLDAIHLSPETYSATQAETLFALGQRVSDPKHNTITSAALNDAAGTVNSPQNRYNEAATLDSLQIEQFGVPPIRSEGRKYYQPLNNLTAAQQVNFDRVNRGLPEVDTFTLEEARGVLGNKFPQLFDILVEARAEDPMALIPTKEFTFEKDAKDLIQEALESKNITSTLASSEVKRLAEVFTGDKNIKDMSASQRRHFYYSTLSLLQLDSPTRLPNFTPRQYNREQFAAATKAVQERGDGTVENIVEFIGPMETEARARSVARQIQSELKAQGVIAADETVPFFEKLPAPEVAPTVEIPDAEPEQVSDDLIIFRRNLRKVLSGFGLNDVGLNVDEVLKAGIVTQKGEIIPIGDPESAARAESRIKGARGYYLPYINRIFLGLDRIDPGGTETTFETRQAAMSDTLTHETVHALRMMDLWTNKEWLSLESLAKKRTRQGNVTYYQDAQELYRGRPGMTPVGIMEEAVANLIKDARVKPRLITSKPKGLINRMYEFFERIRSALKGTGFQSFGDIMGRLEAGEVGARERGEIRTLRATERAERAVPERGIGRPVDVADVPLDVTVDQPAVQLGRVGATGQDIGPAGVDTPQTQRSGFVEDQREQAQREIDAAIESSPLDSVRRAVDEELTRPILEQDADEGGPPPLTFQSKTYHLRGQLHYQAADKYIGLKDVEASINRWRKQAGLPPLTALESAYEGEERLSGKIGGEIREFEHNRVEPLAKKIAAADESMGVTTEEVDDYLMLRHAIERNAVAHRRTAKSRDPEMVLDPETNPGSGALKSGERLADSFVKERMKSRYGMDWNDSTDIWSGGNERGQLLQDIAVDADQIIEEANDRLVKGGLVSRADADLIGNYYNYYTPLRGKDMEDDIASTFTGGGGLTSKGAEYKRVKGRQSAAESPLGHIMVSAERAIARSNNNKEFGQSLVNLIRQHPNDEFWEVYSPDNPRYTQEFEKKYTYVGTDPSIPEGTTAVDLSGVQDKKNWAQQIVPKANSGIASDSQLLQVKEDGQTVYVDIKGDQRLRNAILSLDSTSAGFIVKNLGAVNRWLSMMNTMLNPEFVIGNFEKDIQTAIHNLLGEQYMPGGKAAGDRLIGKVLRDTPHSLGVFYRGLRRWNPKDSTFSHALGLPERDQADFREFIEAGAKADWHHSRPAEDQVKTIGQLVEMERGTFKGNFQRRFITVKDFVEDTNSAVENAVRLSTFKAGRDALLDAGIDRAEAVARASSLAKNLTINFNRKGMQGDLLNSLYLFFNASVQGTMNFSRGLFGPKGNPFSAEASRVKQGAVGGMIAMGALLAMKAEEESEEDPDTGRSYYSQIEPYIKERNIVIMADPTTESRKGSSNIYVGADGNEYEGTQHYYLIPLPYGYNIFHNVGSNLYEVTNGLKSKGQAASDLVNTFLGSFLPVGANTNVLKTFTPTIATPFLEIAYNENFYGAPIYRTNLPFGDAPQYPDSALSQRNTATAFKTVAQWINTITTGNAYEPGWLDVSPDTLEHLAEYAFGGAGKFGLRSSKAIKKWAAGEDVEYRETPFLRRMIREPTSAANQREYFDRRERLRRKGAAQENLPFGTERNSYRKKNMPYLRMIPYLDGAQKQLRQINQRIKGYRDKAARSPEAAAEAALKEDELIERKNKVYARFNKKYDERVGRTK
tara:strand:+ start:283 stop:6771 length:6489 start_codon:yes stop_codon:yes gene_type:complete